MAAVLVVDDDPTVREVVITYLTKAGHTVTSAADGNEALASVAKSPPELVVLDLMLPGRRRARGVPPLAREQRHSRDHADGQGHRQRPGRGPGARRRRLRHQAVQPARARAAGRLGAASYGQSRARPAARCSPATSWSTRDHASSRWPETRVAMTAREFDLLHHLVSHAGKVFSREDLLRDVWGWSFGDDSTVTVHVRRLREKLEEIRPIPRAS